MGEAELVETQPQIKIKQLKFRRMGIISGIPDQSSMLASARDT